MLCQIKGCACASAHTILRPPHLHLHLAPLCPPQQSRPGHWALGSSSSSSSTTTTTTRQAECGLQQRQRTSRRRTRCLSVNRALEVPPLQTAPAPELSPQKAATPGAGTAQQPGASQPDTLPVMTIVTETLASQVR